MSGPIQNWGPAAGYEVSRHDGIEIEESNYGGDEHGQLPYYSDEDKSSDNGGECGECGYTSKDDEEYRGRETPFVDSRSENSYSASSVHAESRDRDGCEYRRPQVFIRPRSDGSPSETRARESYRRPRVFIRPRSDGSPSETRARESYRRPRVFIRPRSDGSHSETRARESYRRPRVFIEPLSHGSHPGAARRENPFRRRSPVHEHHQALYTTYQRPQPSYVSYESSAGYGFAEPPSELTPHLDRLHISCPEYPNTSSSTGYFRTNEARLAFESVQRQREGEDVSQLDQETSYTPFREDTPPAGEGRRP